MRRGTAGLAVLLLVISAALPVAADHDWAPGCSLGNTCWYEGNFGGGYMQSDHRDTYTFNDWYAGNGNQSIGWHTDYFKNRMAVTHAHVYRNSNYNGELFCVNPNSVAWYWVGGTTTTGSFRGHPSSLGGCRA